MFATPKRSATDCQDAKRLAGRRKRDAGVERVCAGGTVAHFQGFEGLFPLRSFSPDIRVYNFTKINLL